LLHYDLFFLFTTLKARSQRMSQGLNAEPEGVDNRPERIDSLIDASNKEAPPEAKLLGSGKCILPNWNAGPI
jgi:hypothetical protein